MFGFLERRIDLVGFVTFRGGLPPRAEDFAHLGRHGTQITPGDDRADAHWSLDLRHPTWGEARLFAPRGSPLPPRLLVDLDRRLSTAEKEAAALAGSSVAVHARSSGQILRDRKHLLRWLGAVMADDGLLAGDVLAQSFWSRAGLDAELAHDADVDVSALFTIHAITGEREGAVRWAHTHGLAEVGAFDLDVLRPSETVFADEGAVFRALAFAAVEGKIEPTTASFPLVPGAPPLRLVPAATFQKAPADERALRDDDDDHRERRAVVCDPAGLFSRWFGGVRASRLLSAPMPDGNVFSFTNAATALMAARARATTSVLAALAEELRELELPVLAKLGYRVDGGGENDREHLWFEVHGFGDGTIDATLLNEPHWIARMHAGSRGEHDLDLLSDWTILTPLGSISPRSTAIAREVRARRDEIQRIVSEARARAS